MTSLTESTGSSPGAALSKTASAATSPLTDEMLARFSTRAATYDRENTFFTDDFEELRQGGYLRLAVPTEFGGAGLRLSEVVREQRRLGYHAAPTALAINRHLYWTPDPKHQTERLATRFA